MNRSLVAAAILAASFSAAPLAAQLDPQPAPAADPASDVVPGGVLPPAPALPDPAPGVTPGPLPLPSGDAALPPAPEAAPLPAPAPEAAPAPLLPPVAQTFTDADVTGFARAVIAIEPIRTDAMLDEAAKQAKMGEVLAQSGIAVDTFNAMAVQSRTDASLKARIQTQIAALQAAQPPAA